MEALSERDATHIFSWPAALDALAELLPERVSSVSWRGF